MLQLECLDKQLPIAEVILQPLIQLLILVVLLDLLDPADHVLAILSNPAWLILNQLLKHELDEEDYMQGSEGQVVQFVLLSFIVDILEPLRGEHDEVNADYDAQIDDEL